MISGRSRSRARARARARNNLVFSWKLSGLSRSSTPLLPTNSVDKPTYKRNLSTGTQPASNGQPHPPQVSIPLRIVMISPNPKIPNDHLVHPTQYGERSRHHRSQGSIAGRPTPHRATPRRATAFGEGSCILTTAFHFLRYSSSQQSSASWL
jgi:hypothetical protein